MYAGVSRIFMRGQNIFRCRFEGQSRRILGAHTHGGGGG